MEVIGNRTVKDVAAVRPGELIRFANGEHGSLGIVVEIGEGMPLVAALNDPHESHPRLIRPYESNQCLSYGIDWCLEPIEGVESYPWHHQVNRRSGLLTLLGDGWFLSVAASGVDQLGRFTVKWINLETQAISEQVDRRGAFYSRWIIWQSAQDRANPNASPLFEFEAKPTAVAG